MRFIKSITAWSLSFIMIFSSLNVLSANKTEIISDDNFIVDELESEFDEGLDDVFNKDEVEIKKDDDDVLIPDIIQPDSSQINDKEEKPDSTIIQPESYLSNIEFLSALGIYRFSDKDYNKAVTRGEFASMIMDLLAGSTPTVSESKSFDDVNGGTEHADAIHFVSCYGLMNGTGDGKFQPEKPITYMQALKTVIAALGYSELANVQGGYPNGYLKIAQNLNLIKGAPRDYNGPLSFETATVLLCLAAEAELCEILFVTDKGAYYQTNDARLLINVYHNIYTDRGVMTDNGRTAVNHASHIGKEQVLIGDRKLFSATNTIRDSIGQNLTYYYRDDCGVYTLLYAFADERYNDVVKINADLLERDSQSFTKECLVANINGRIKKFSIDKYANLLYNGIFDDTFTRNSLKICEGYIVLIDADKDGDYELVRVEEYKDIVVGDHIVNDCITALYTVPGYSTIKYREFDTVIFENGEGKEIDPSKVLSNNVVSVYKSKDNKVVRFVQSTSTRKIQITTIEMTDDNIILSYDDESWSLSKNYFNLINTSPELYPTPIANTFYEASYNFENKIVYLKQSYGQKQYAYLMRMGNGDGLHSKDVQLLLHLESDDTVIVTAKEKLTINGVKGRPAEELWNISGLVKNGEVVPQLVSVVLNDSGNLISIETDNDVNDDIVILDPNGDGILTDDEMEKIQKQKGNYSLRYNPGKFSLDYWLGEGYSGPQYHGADFKAIYGSVCVTEDTKIFLVGTQNRNLQSSDPEEVKVISYAEYTGGLVGNSYIKLYDTDIAWVAGAAVVTEMCDLSWSLLYVDDSAYVYDKHTGETKLRVTGYFGAQSYFTYRESEAGIIRKAVLERYPGSDGALKKGDVLQIALNSNQEIGDALLFYSPMRDTDPDYNFVDVYTNTTSTQKHIRMASGAVMILGRLCVLQNGRFGIFTKANPDYVPCYASYSQPIDNAADSYWVHSASKSTRYMQFDCTTGELKKISLHDIAGGSDFSVDTFASGDGSVKLANFTNYDEDKKYFILRMSGSPRIIYEITGMIR